MAYSPEANLTMEAVLKLKECQNIQGFDKLSMKLDELKERAGFSMSQVGMPFSYIYDDSLTMCIWSWICDSESALRATWRNFIHVLKEPGMDLHDLAKQIEHCLSTTSTSRLQTSVIQTSKAVSFTLHIWLQRCVCNAFVDVLNRDCNIAKIFLYS